MSKKSGGARTKTKDVPTLCWNCQRAAGSVTQRCEWSRSFRPVPGWIALPAPVTVGTGGGKHIELSYRVIRCPQFVPDERIKRCPQAQRHGCIEGATRLCDSCRYYTIKNKGNY